MFTFAPIFMSVVLFTVWLNFARKRSTSIQTKKSENFWEKESRANHTRKNSLDCLDYITIPLNLPALCTASGDAALLEQERTLSALSGKKIVNLTGISNTDLKLIYGTSNLAFLIECDQNFTLLARTLQTCAARFYELGNRHTAVIFLEFAVSCKSDISKTYSLLSKIYEENGEPEKIHTLLEAAGQLNSLMKPSIIRHLESAI